MKNEGFTLIEMVILLIIMGILGSIVGVRMSSLNSFRSEAFGGVLKSDLKLTKVLSMARNARYRLVIGSSSYQIQDQNGNVFLNPQTNTTTVPFPATVTVSPATTVVFDSQGQPYDSTGTTALSTALTITVTSASLSQTVTISPQTGFIQ